jgi:hypothetical protein
MNLSEWNIQHNKERSEWNPKLSEFLHQLFKVLSHTEYLDSLTIFVFSLKLFYGGKYVTYKNQFGHFRASLQRHVMEQPVFHHKHLILSMLIKVVWNVSQLLQSKN